MPDFKMISTGELLIYLTCWFHFCGCADGKAFYKDDVIDMTHPLDERSIGFPGLKQLKHKFDRHPSLLFNTDWVELGFYSVSEHVGTHMDAPSHFSKGNWRIHEIPVHRLVGAAVKLDITKQTKNNRDYTITVEDLERWESINGHIPEGAILFIQTGLSEFYPDLEKYALTSDLLNGFDASNKPLIHSPGLSREAALWIVKRSLYGLCIDAMSYDVGQTTKYPAHNILLSNRIWAVENVASMKDLPTTGAIASVYPANIRDSSGPPTRVVALKIKLHDSWWFLRLTFFAIISAMILIIAANYAFRLIYTKKNDGFKKS